jgi:hypothetical protein
MPNVAKRLAQTQPGTSYATAYTVPASTSTIVREVVACNTTASSVVLDVSLVASGGTAGVTNNVIAQHTLQPYQTVIYTFSQVLATGGFVSAKAGTASAITLTVSGVEIT